MPLFRPQKYPEVGATSQWLWAHNGTLLSHNKNKIMPFAATSMDLERIILSEVSQKEKGKYHMIPLTCRI